MASPDTSVEAFLQQDSATLTVPLRALWHDAHGNWKAAHEAAQADEQDPDSAWVHAYLHRKEGDAFNAGYWYRRAAKPVCRGSLEQEWIDIVNALSVRELKIRQADGDGDGLSRT